MVKKLLIRLSENKMQSLSKHKNLKDARILITNDDGYEADGIKLLTEIIEPMVKDVWVIAPSKESSGSGHSLTPVRLTPLPIPVAAPFWRPQDVLRFPVNLANFTPLR